MFRDAENIQINSSWSPTISLFSLIVWADGESWCACTVRATLGSHFHFHLDLGHWAQLTDHNYSTVLSLHLLWNQWMVKSSSLLYSNVLVLEVSSCCFMCKLLWAVSGSDNGNVVVWTINTCTAHTQYILGRFLLSYITNRQEDMNWHTEHWTKSWTQLPDLNFHSGEIMSTISIAIRE